MRHELPIFQVDAFASRRFSGNPAAVVPLASWLPDDVLQSIALENQLSETAFFVPEGDVFHLRWFTPTVEVSLCGHATLATAFILFTELAAGRGREELRFRSMSGELSVRRDGERLVLDFPRRVPIATQAPAGLTEAIGTSVLEVLDAGEDMVAVVERSEQVQKLDPDLRFIKAHCRRALMVTGPGDDCDFVSRFFAPESGIDEDPVTGSAHCALTPYWAARLGKTRLFARQLSPRGGELWCEDLPPRVTIAGQAVLYLRGEIYVDTM
jgi:PhzF family phenazine biosynthesis protein